MSYYGQGLDEDDVWREDKELARIEAQPYSTAYPAQEHPDEIKKVQQYSRLTPEQIKGPLVNRRDRRIVGDVESARTPEEAVYVADRLARDAWADDYDTNLAEADIRELAERIQNGHLSQHAMSMFNRFIPSDFRSGLSLVATEEMARALGSGPMIDGNNGYIRASAVKQRMAGEALTGEAAAQLMYETMYNRGKYAAERATINLPGNDAIAAARASELIQAARMSAVRNVPSYALDGYVDGVIGGISQGDTKLVQMINDIGLDIFNTDKGSLNLLMRHGNSDPGIVRTQDGKPSSISFYAQPNGEYVAAHESRDRETYGHLVDGIHRDQNKVLRNADEAMKYAQWLGEKSWYTNYVNPLQPLNRVKQFSPVGGEFVDWRTRAAQARR